MLARNPQGGLQSCGNRPGGNPVTGKPTPAWLQPFEGSSGQNSPRISPMRRHTQRPRRQCPPWRRQPSPPAACGSGLSMRPSSVQPGRKRRQQGDGAEDQPWWPVLAVTPIAAATTATDRPEHGRSIMGGRPGSAVRAFSWASIWGFAWAVNGLHPQRNRPGPKGPAPQQRPLGGGAARGWSPIGDTCPAPSCRLEHRRPEAEGGCGVPPAEQPRPHSGPKPMRIGFSRPPPRWRPAPQGARLGSSDEPPSPPCRCTAATVTSRSTCGRGARCHGRLLRRGGRRLRAWISARQCRPLPPSMAIAPWCGRRGTQPPPRARRAHQWFTRAQTAATSSEAPSTT